MIGPDQVSAISRPTRSDALLTQRLNQTPANEVYIIDWDRDFAHIYDLTGVSVGKLLDYALPSGCFLHLQKRTSVETDGLRSYS